MPVFGKEFYSFDHGVRPDVGGYRVMLETVLGQCASPAERDQLLRQEAVEITRQVTESIRELVRHDKHIRHLVLDLGAVPLATWAEALDTTAEHLMPALKRKITEMQYDLDHGKVEGFPGTMILHGKPTFATLEGFYRVVFELAEGYDRT